MPQLSSSWLVTLITVTLASLHRHTICPWTLSTRRLLYSLAPHSKGSFHWAAPAPASSHKCQSSHVHQPSHIGMVLVGWYIWLWWIVSHKHHHTLQFSTNNINFIKLLTLSWGKGSWYLMTPSLANLYFIMKVPSHLTVVIGHKRELPQPCSVCVCCLSCFVGGVQQPIRQTRQFWTLTKPNQVKVKNCFVWGRLKVTKII